MRIIWLSLWVWGSPSPLDLPSISPVSPLYLRHISPPLQVWGAMLTFYVTREAPRTHISPVSPMYLPFISPVSPLHLPYISPVSPMYLPRYP